MTKIRKGAGGKQYPPRVGGVRPSQLMYSFGVGALLDLPNFSVIVAGLDDWDETQQVELGEERLVAAIRADRTLGLGQVRRLRSAPWMEETGSPFEQWAWVGVPVLPFPRWLRCTACNLLSTVDTGLFELSLAYRPDRARYVHRNCTSARGKAPSTVPARFVVACSAGHIDEFPWREFVHSPTGGRCPKGNGLLRAMDTGSGSRSTDLIVQCMECDAKRLLTNAFNENAQAFLPECRGRHAHLRRFDGDCQQQVRPLLLGASNAWFPAIRSVLSIPTSSDPLEQAVEDCWGAIEDPAAPINSIEALRFAVARDPRLAALKAMAADVVWAAIVARRARPTEREGEADVLSPEWDVFTAPQAALESRDFRLGTPAPIPGFVGIAEVVPVERVREVVALCGFTRIDGPDSGLVDDMEGGVAFAPLSRRPLDWLPAAEVRGEGIFLRFDEARVAGWVQSIAGGDQLEGIREAHQRWRRNRGFADVNFGWPGERYVLLHSLAHALIHELALECGYSAASIRERLYARDPGDDGKGAMAGLLLYTSAPDAEGTLGGLVALAEPDEFERLLEAALRRVGLCSADPMCAGHRPGDAETTLHNAACHACLFLPETSCERANRYLDRSVLTRTVCERGVEFGFRG